MTIERERELPAPDAADDLRRRFGSMERIPFYYPSPPFTVLPSGVCHPVCYHPSGPAFDSYHSCCNVHLDPAAGSDSTPPPRNNTVVDYAGAPSGHLCVEMLSTAGSGPPRHGSLPTAGSDPTPPPRNNTVVDYPGAPAQHPFVEMLFTAGSGPPRHGSLPTAGSPSQGTVDHTASRPRRNTDRGRPDSYYADAARHFAAAAKYMDKAAGASESENGDIELGPPSDVDGGGSSTVDGGSSTTTGGGGGSGDAEEKFWKRENTLGFFVLVLQYALPVGAYIGANPYFQTTAGLWTLIFMGLVFTFFTALSSVLIRQKSRSALAVFVRVLFLLGAIAAEATVAISVCSQSQNKGLAKSGSVFSISHLIIIYVVGWYLHCRETEP